MAGALRDLLDLSGRRGVVTGAARGLGAIALATGIARHMVARGGGTIIWSGLWVKTVPPSPRPSPSPREREAF